MKYLQRNSRGILIDGTYEVDSSIRKYLNSLCLKYGSTYEGRIQATKDYLNRYKEVPLFINKDVVLIHVGSIRYYETTLINATKILSITQKKEVVKIVFDDCSEITLKVSFKRIVLQYKLSKSLPF